MKVYMFDSLLRWLRGDDDYKGDAEHWRAMYMIERDILIKVRAENNALRAIAAEVMPCHYCGVDNIAKCPHGFPGCSLADDVFCGEESYAKEIQRLRKELETIKRKETDD